MITVEYYPAYERSPLPNGDREHVFETYHDFKEWVKGYVCIHCLETFKAWHGKEPETLADWLDGGCGCEIGIDDPDEQICWNDIMEYPTEYIKKD